MTTTMPSGVDDRVVHLWTDGDGQAWACACYDHGPFCRLCQRADAMTLVLLDGVRDGLLTVVADADGELRFGLTDEGVAEAKHRIETDPELAAFYDGLVVDDMERHLEDGDG